MKPYFAFIIFLLSTCTLFEDREVVEFENVKNMRFLWFSQPGTEVINDDISYQALRESNWSRWISEGDTMVLSNLPEIDFESTTFIIVHYGVFPNGDLHGVDVISKVENTDDVLVVTLSKLQDLEAWATPSSPVQAITIKRVGLPVEFVGYIP